VRDRDSGAAVPSTVLIRLLTEADADELFELRLRALQESPEAFGSTYAETRERGPESFRRRLGQPATESFTLGAYTANILVGIVAFFRETGEKDRHKGYIVSMYVEPQSRGKGIGRALAREAVARAGQVPRIVQLHLSVVTSNTAARSLYLSLGFTVYGLEPRALKQGEDQYWDEELMILRLDE
jgi:ribosomal protein S18 acetylase RimI-like enzyme